MVITDNNLKNTRPRAGSQPPERARVYLPDTDVLVRVEKSTQIGKNGRRHSFTEWCRSKFSGKPPYRRGSMLLLRPSQERQGNINQATTKKSGKYHVSNPVNNATANSGASAPPKPPSGVISRPKLDIPLNNASARLDNDNRTEDYKILRPHQRNSMVFASFTRKEDFSDHSTLVRYGSLRVARSTPLHQTPVNRHGNVTSFRP